MPSYLRYCYLKAGQAGSTAELAMAISSAVTKRGMAAASPVLPAYIPIQRQMHFCPKAPLCMRNILINYF